MSVTLSIWSASMGIVSLTSMPATFVLIGLNSPRTLDGALGLGSQISIWLGPPCRNSMMTDLAGAGGVERFFEELSQLCGDAGRAIVRAADLARNAKANHARGVIELIVHEWHKEHRASRSHRLGRGANPALVYDRRGARKDF